MVAWVWQVAWWTVLLVVPQTIIRTWCSARVYGWKFAALVPLRVPWANCINCCASVKAIWGYVNACLRGVPLRWLKTEHAYPNRQALVSTRRKLGEILLDQGSITVGELERALVRQPVGVRLGEHLVKLGYLSEEKLYEALSLQHNLPAGRPEEDAISPDATRTIPADLARRWKVLPFNVVAGQLYVASPEVPTEQMVQELKEFCPLEMRFHLVPPLAFRQLMEEYLPPLPPTSVPSFLTGVGLLASVVAIAGAWGKVIPGRAAGPR